MNIQTRQNNGYRILNTFLRISSVSGLDVACVVRNIMENVAKDCLVWRGFNILSLWSNLRARPSTNTTRSTYNDPLMRERLSLIIPWCLKCPYTPSTSASTMCSFAHRSPPILCDPDEPAGAPSQCQAPPPHSHHQHSGRTAASGASVQLGLHKP